jgi:hypothetical protein
MAEAAQILKASTFPTINMSSFLQILTPVLLLAGVALIVVGVLIQVGIIKTSVPSRVTQLKNSNPVFTQKSAFPIQALQPNQQYLVNYSPITAYLAGYIGAPNGGVQGGSFDPQTYLSLAFAAGIRSFVLPISSYVDNNKTPDNGFPYAGEPAVVCRDLSGTIISSNGMSIGDFINALLVKKGENSYYAHEPIFLFLEEQTGHVPDPVKEENKYVAFMSKIAEGLSGLDAGNMRVVQLDNFGNLGSLVGGEREQELLTLVPVSDFKNKVIIFTNFQTSLANKPAYTKLNKKSLHEYSNFIYSPYATASNTTQISTNKACKSVSLTDVSGSTVNWLRTTQTSFFIANNPTPLQLPDPSVVTQALSQGIQCVPIPFFFNDNNLTNPLYTIFKGSSAAVKPVKDPDSNLFTKQPPIVPAKPSQTMNARVSPTSQPGQVNVA